MVFRILAALAALAVIGATLVLRTWRRKGPHVYVYVRPMVVAGPLPESASETAGAVAPAWLGNDAEIAAKGFMTLPFRGTLSSGDVLDGTIFVPSTAPSNRVRIYLAGSFATGDPCQGKRAVEPLFSFDDDKLAVSDSLWDKRNENRLRATGTSGSKTYSFDGYVLRDDDTNAIVIFYTDAHRAKIPSWKCP